MTTGWGLWFDASPAIVEDTPAWHAIVAAKIEQAKAQALEDGYQLVGTEVRFTKLAELVWVDDEEGGGRLVSLDGPYGFTMFPPGTRPDLIRYRIEMDVTPA